MAKAKKTIEIKFIKDMVNEQLNNPNVTIEEKFGMIAVLESVTHRANCYNGYMYTRLDAEGSAPRIGTENWVFRKYF
jgi:hypothetical protein